MKFSLFFFIHCVVIHSEGREIQQSRSKVNSSNGNSMRKGCKKKKKNPTFRTKWKKKWWKKCSFFLRFTTRRWFPALRNKILEGNVCKYFHRYEFLLCRFGLFFDTWIFSLGAFLKPQIAWCKIVNSIYCPVWGIYWNLSNLSNISLKKKRKKKKQKNWCSYERDLRNELELAVVLWVLELLGSSFILLHQTWSS